MLGVAGVSGSGGSCESAGWHGRVMGEHQTGSQGQERGRDRDRDRLGPVQLSLVCKGIRGCV